MAPSPSRAHGADRYARLRRIEALDVKADYRRIVRLFYTDFQSVMVALPFAGFLTTFASPRMSRILSSTGELEHRFAKRAVDTSLLAATVMEHGFGTGLGGEAARRVNALHKRYDIHPDDFVLVGCDPPMFSLDMADRYGWRPVSAKEREALRIFYDHEARAFGSPRKLPASESEMRQLVSDYFDTQLAFEPQNLRMAKVALDFYSELAPPLLRPVLRRTLVAMLDPRVRRACGLPAPSWPSRLLAHGFIKMMGRRDPLADTTEPGVLAELARKVYPNGYETGMLGPCPMHAPRAAAERPAAMAET